MIFLWTPASLIVSLLVLLAGAACCLISWRRGGKTRPLALLELLRFTLIEGDENEDNQGEAEQFKESEG
ncbi:MAG: hypothetical protein ACKPJD_13570, partial [Planctomycetaceae bacterium]